MTIKENAKGHYSLKKWINRAFCNFAADFSFTKDWKNAWCSGPKSKKPHSGNYSNANSAMLCSCGSLGVYTMSIILTGKHSDNLIGLLKSPLWERLAFPEMILYKATFEWQRKMYQDLLCKGKTHEKFKMKKTNEM